MAFIKHIFKSPPKDRGDFFIAIKSILGFKPKDLSIYKEAFTHRSMNEKKDSGEVMSYERLEFLGDAILSTIIAAYLYKEVPGGNEGYLTKMRSKVVSRKHLNILGEELNLIHLVKSNLPKSNFSLNIHGNVFEALIGAIYLDRGFKYCKTFIYKKVIEPHVDINRLEGKIISYKSLVIEWCQKHKKEFKYITYDDNGKDHVKHFAVMLKIDSDVVSKARATSKKKAEEKAAKRAFYKLQAQISKSSKH